MTESNDDIEEQRRLAKDWRPDVDGPLVGPVLPTSDFLSEFPSTDPRHPKIANLAESFPSYRRMKGDGSCGYRALAYGFLHALIRSAVPPSSPSAAAERLRDMGKHFDSLQSLFKPRGWEPFIYGDWLLACTDLCESLATTLLGSEGQADNRKAAIEILDARLNDDEAGIEILQYLRGVTSSWMLAHEADFAPFVIGSGNAGPEDSVKGWCELNVDPPAAEMEEQSLLAFYQAVIQRTGIPVHVHYLEQSQGEKLAVSEYEPADGKKADDVEAVHLLYRPGHYDLLLKG